MKSRSRRLSTSAHWFGTDNFGRDCFTRVLYGGRVSLSVGLLSMLMALMPVVPSPGQPNRYSTMYAPDTRLPMFMPTRVMMGSVLLALRLHWLPSSGMRTTGVSPLGDGAEHIVLGQLLDGFAAHIAHVDGYLADAHKSFGGGA